MLIILQSLFMYLSPFQILIIWNTNYLNAILIATALKMILPQSRRLLLLMEGFVIPVIGLQSILAQSVKMSKQTIVHFEL